MGKNGKKNIQTDHKKHKNEKDRERYNAIQRLLQYKRDGHLDSAAYEEGFITEYLSHLGSDRIRSYLTNSGMAAFSTVLHWLRDEIKVAGNALAVTPMYFENIHLAIVVHGTAVHDVTRDSAGANADLVAALVEHGVEIFVCGQSAVWYDIAAGDLLPGVSMSLSAMTAHARLQSDGYTLNPF